jgi:hypothetical protein
MPITSLNNFSVPTDAGNQVLLMPKLKYRFRVTLLGFGVTAATELTKQVIDVSRPKVSFEEMELPVYNSRVYLAGRYLFETLTLNLRDDASGEVQKLVGQQVQKQFDFVEQASARSGIDYKFTTKIETLDGGNGGVENGVNVLETFNCYGCFVQNVDYGDANYGTNEAMTVALTIRFDNMVQWGAGATGVGVGIGANVGRNITNTASTGAAGTQA